MPSVVRILLSLLFLITCSIAFTWFVFWRQNLNDVDAAWEFIFEHRHLAAYSALVIFLLLTTLAAIIWRPFLAAGIGFSVLSILMFIHAEKYKLRSAPLLPEDLMMADQAGNMMSFVDFASVVRLVLGVVFVLIGSGLLDFYAKRVLGKERNSPWWERFAVVPRVCFTMVSIAALSIVAKPIVQADRVAEADREWIGEVDLQLWNPIETYRESGFVIGFMHNLGGIQTPMPESYSEEKIQEIARKYQTLKAEDDKNRKPLEELVDNLILVMNESFYDPELLYEYYAHTNGDVVPNLREVFKKYPSGYMYSPEYGGNTANIEFEAFTGLSNFWAKSIPYTKSVARMDRLPGLVSLAAGEGFDTMAVHAYDGAMYKRNLVYDHMGFDEFIDKDKMAHTALENSVGFISDNESYSEVIDLIDKPGKHFVGLVTMQNHGGYDSAHYPELRFKLLDESIDGYWIESSFESLNHSDQYLKNFIEKMDALDEKTAMIWFGDHATGVLEKYIESSDQSLVNKAHFTPYFVYANFELENDFTKAEVEESNRELGFEFETPGVDLPTVTPNCLSNILYDILGAQKPTLAYLTSEICTTTPVLARAYFTGGEKLEDYQALRDYELVNYDILNGKRYWLNFVDD